tara:strand:- start:17731 stop:17967 length:237 start_codon:yes stop_codon:yes gene_type:complete
MSILKPFNLATATKDYQAKQKSLTDKFIEKVQSYKKAAENQVVDCEATIREVSRAKQVATQDIAKANDVLIKAKSNEL